MDATLLGCVARGRDAAELRLATGLTRSKITARLNRLELAIGAVVDTSTDVPRITIRGAKLVWAASMFFDALDAAFRAVLGRAHGASEVFTLEVFDLAFGAMLDLSCPGTDAPIVEVRHSQPDQAFSAVASGMVDAAITWQVGNPRLTCTPGLREHVVVEEPPMVAVPDEHSLSGRCELTLAELVGHDLVVGQCDGRTPVVDALCRSEGLSALPRAERARTSSMARALALRRGVPLICWPTNGLDHVNGWRTVPLAVGTRRTVRLITDRRAVPESAARSLLGLLQHGHKAHVESTLGPSAASRCSYPAPRVEGGIVVTPSIDGIVTGSSRNRQMDAADFFLLRAVKATGSINRAARVLAASQSAVSRRVQGLERDLGAPVLIRSTTGARLSVEMELVYKRVAVHSARVAAVLDELAATRVGRAAVPLASPYPSGPRGGGGVPRAPGGATPLEVGGPLVELGSGWFRPVLT